MTWNLSIVWVQLYLIMGIGHTELTGSMTAKMTRLERKITVIDGSAAAAAEYPAVREVRLRVGSTKYTQTWELPDEIRAVEISTLRDPAGLPVAACPPESLVFSKLPRASTNG